MVERRSEEPRVGGSNPSTPAILVRPLLARDAAGAGHFVRASLKGHRKVSRSCSDACAEWGARWAGHWGRWALGQETLT